MVELPSGQLLVHEAVDKPVIDRAVASYSASFRIVYPVHLHDPWSGPQIQILNQCFKELKKKKNCNLW